MDMGIKKTIVLQWNDSYFIAADNGILYVSSKNGCIIHDRLPSEATLMFCFSGLSYRKGWITKRH
jgi:S-adenosylmethionine hydrolase